MTEQSLQTLPRKGTIARTFLDAWFSHPKGFRFGDLVTLYSVCRNNIKPQNVNCNITCYDPLTVLRLAKRFGTKDGEPGSTAPWKFDEDRLLYCVKLDTVDYESDVRNFFEDLEERGIASYYVKSSPSNISEYLYTGSYGTLYKMIADYFDPFKYTTQAKDNDEFQSMIDSIETFEQFYYQGTVYWDRHLKEKIKVKQIENNNDDDYIAFIKILNNANIKYTEYIATTLADDDVVTIKVSGRLVVFSFDSSTGNLISIT